MNNSELSTTKSAQDVFIVSETNVYPPSRDASSRNGPQSSTAWRNENCDNRVTGVGCAQPGGNESQDTRTVDVRLAASEPDLGMWLLDGSAKQHEQWERILTAAP